ncbi:hypothetical protein HRR78_001661 [Exophiala dermatitidis]|nr:hypothetical protein HRR78_001661 [Exophiala dermatitidis]
MAAWILFFHAPPHPQPEEREQGLAQIALAALAASLTLAAPSPHRGQAGSGRSGFPTAVYLLTNEANNAVVALPVGADGTLSLGKVTGTGGAGANSIDGTSNQPAAPDALIGQSALTVAGNHLFAVNAGSNTLTMLSIDPQNPTQLAMVGQPVNLPGEFPNTVAASIRHRLVCVGTTGAANGVSSSRFSRNGLVGMDNLRSFGLKQSTPPVGPTNSVSQLFFSQDESKLFATVKGDPATGNTGFFSAFSVIGHGRHQSASVSAQDVRSSPNGTAVLFGSANIPGTSSVFATDASFGAAILAVDPKSGQASLAAKQAIDGQKATCWATISPATSSAFVTDVGVNRLLEMSLEDASILFITDLSANGDPGLIDLKAAGNFVYALSPGNGTTPASVSVLDVSGGQGSAKLFQHFALQGLGAGKNSQGMAVF